MTFGKLMGFCLSLVFSAMTANAAQDVTCVDNDCFRFGWDVVTDRGPGYAPMRSWVECVEEDCLINGWVQYVPGYQPVEVMCKGSGCFENGWYVFQPGSDRIQSEVNCFPHESQENSCLKNGWEVLHGNGARETVECLRGDCTQYGWLSQAPGYPKVRSRCKEGGCFQQGWTVLQ